MQKKRLTIQLTDKQKEQMRKATGHAPDVVAVEVHENELRAKPVTREDRTKE